MASDRLTDAVRVVSQFLVADASLGDTLGRIAQLAQAAIDGADAVGVTLLDDSGRPVTAVFTDPVSPAVDQAQYDEGSGPCLEAFREGRTVRVEDTRTTADRWPAFSLRAASEGVLSTLGVPLKAGRETLGVFNLYSKAAGAFARHDEDDTGLFVTQAAVVLANTRAYWEMFDLATGLRVAMTSRASIEQAKGVIMATTGCTADDAFRLLREQSQQENRKLREIALEIVAGSARQ